MVAITNHYLKTLLVMIFKNRLFCKLRSTLLVSVFVLSACDSEGLDSVGGGAGDTDGNASDVALISPFQGIYELPSAWNGIEGDIAYLVISAPSETGVATASLYDYDEFENCLPEPPNTGIVVNDVFTNRVFMNDILQLEQAILALANQLLLIEFNDNNDINSNSNTNERVQISATRLAVALITDVGSGVTC